MDWTEAMLEMLKHKVRQAFEVTGETYSTY